MRNANDIIIRDKRGNFCTIRIIYGKLCITVQFAGTKDNSERMALICMAAYNIIISVDLVYSSQWWSFQSKTGWHQEIN